MEARRGPREEWGITEGKKRRIVNLTDGSENPVGEWNSMTIEAVGSAIRVWVNGNLVNDGFGATADRGQIALQAEGSEVEFRKVALTPIEELTATGSHAMIQVNLTARVPSETRSIRYSPRGEKLSLDADGNATLRLAGTDFQLRLERSADSDHYDRLWVDTDGDGDLTDETPVTTTPSETRGKIWSSFDAVVELPVTDSESDAASTIPYSTAFWYVFDPLEPDVEQVIRYSRRGWMEGTAVVDGVPAVVMITESVMDGRFDTDDNWALVKADSVDKLLAFDRSRDANRHAWLGERAYRLVSIDPSGLRVTLQYGDPGITRAEEAEQDDKLAVDRRAPRSGREVGFVDFEAAEARAAAEGLPLFIDFKTVWCGPCYTMDEWVFTADAVVDAAASVIASKVDGDERRDLASRFEVTAYPTVLLLASDGTELKRHVGYLGVDSTAAFLAAGQSLVP
jgi:thiol-disulfide isomerase/thioredoxin